MANGDMVLMSDSGDALVDKYGNLRIEAVGPQYATAPCCRYVEPGTDCSACVGTTPKELLLTLSNVGVCTCMSPYPGATGIDTSLTPEAVNRTVRLTQKTGLIYACTWERLNAGSFSVSWYGESGGSCAGAVTWTEHHKMHWSVQFSRTGTAIWVRCASTDIEYPVACSIFAGYKTLSTPFDCLSPTGWVVPAHDGYVCSRDGGFGYDHVVGSGGYATVIPVLE